MAWCGRGDADVVIQCKASELGTGKLCTKVTMDAGDIGQVEVWTDGRAVGYCPWSDGIKDNAGVVLLYADGYEEVRACVSDDDVAWEPGVRSDEFLGGVVGDVDEKQLHITGEQR
jgi:hypothetical protein